MNCLQKRFKHLLTTQKLLSQAQERGYFNGLNRYWIWQPAWAVWIQRCYHTGIWIPIVKTRPSHLYNGNPYRWKSSIGNWAVVCWFNWSLPVPEWWQTAVHNLTRIFFIEIICDINNVTGINVIVKTCSMKITTIASNFKDLYINKLPLLFDVFEDVNTPISCIRITDIDDIEGSNSWSLKYIAKCSTLPYENIPPSVL